MAGPTVDYQSLHDPGTSSRTGSPLSSAAQQPHSTVTSSTKLLQPNENGRKGPRDSHKHDRSDAQTVESIGSEADDSEREGDEQTFLSAEDSPALSELKRRIARRRVVTLACACLLSVGSYVLFPLPFSPKPLTCPNLSRHYSHYTLGPIKKSLKTSEGHFAALLSALELASTITPLLAGLWVPRFGAAAVGLAATGAIFVGQLIVCFAFSREGGVDQNLGGMVCSSLPFSSCSSLTTVLLADHRPPDLRHWCIAACRRARDNRAAAHFVEIRRSLGFSRTRTRQDGTSPPLSALPSFFFHY